MLGFCYNGRSFFSFLAAGFCLPASLLSSKDIGFDVGSTVCLNNEGFSERTPAMNIYSPSPSRVPSKNSPHCQPVQVHQPTRRRHLGTGLLSLLVL